MVIGSVQEVGGTEGLEGEGVSTRYAAYQDCLIENAQSPSGDGCKGEGF